MRTNTALKYIGEISELLDSLTTDFEEFAMNVDNGDLHIGEPAKINAEVMKDQVKEVAEYIYKKLDKIIDSK